MIAVRVIWRGVVFYFRVTETVHIVRAFYPHNDEEIAPQAIPAEVACLALRELYLQAQSH